MQCLILHLGKDEAQSRGGLPSEALRGVAMGTRFHWAGYCLFPCLSLVCEMGPIHLPARRIRSGGVWEVVDAAAVLLVAFPHCIGCPAPPQGDGTAPAGWGGLNPVSSGTPQVSPASLCFDYRALRSARRSCRPPWLPCPPAAPRASRCTWPALPSSR